MKKTLLSLALALALCLGLTVPALAVEMEGNNASQRPAGVPMNVGDTEVTDADGYIFRMSEPVIGEISNFEVFVEGESMTVTDTYYQLAVGTIISALRPDGTPAKFIGLERPGGSGEAFGEEYSSLTLNSVGPVKLFTEGEPLFVYGVEVEQPADPSVTVENIPASGTAYPSAQTVLVDGQPIEFQMYALLDENGNPTNYIKLRDLASVLNGTAAQFSIGYDGVISVTTGQPYASVGTEMFTPFSGDRVYSGGAQAVMVNGTSVSLTAITLTDDAGGDYNYFKLRDLGAALGFNVGWSAEVGAFIETDKPYSGQ